MSDLQPGEAVHIAKRTAVSAVAGLAFVVLSCWVGAGALLVAGMTCDDTCAGDRPPPGGDWTEYSEAAQWSELGWLAGAKHPLDARFGGLGIGRAPPDGVAWGSDLWRGLGPAGWAARRGSQHRRDFVGVVPGDGGPGFDHGARRSRTLTPPRARLPPLVTSIPFACQRNPPHVPTEPLCARGAAVASVRTRVDALRSDRWIRGNPHSP
jgi:hypothetical protein